MFTLWILIIFYLFSNKSSNKKKNKEWGALNSVVEKGKRKFNIYDVIIACFVGCLLIILLVDNEKTYKLEIF